MMAVPVNDSPSITQQETSSMVSTDGYRALFKNKNFMALWVGQVFSQLADRIIFVVFITLITSHFGPQNSLKSFLYVAFTIPAILLTAIAGVFVDRWDRRRTLVITNLLRAVIVAGIPLIMKSNSLMGLYACAFGISAATQFFVPAESATIPMVVPASQLLVANSLFTTTMMGSVIFGFALGDPLIQIFGIHQVHWAIVGLFVLSSLALTFVHAGKPCLSKIANPLHSAFEAFCEEMREGVEYLWKHRDILNKILKLAVLFTYVVSMCFIFISFAQSYLYSDPTIAAEKFAWIIAFSGVGMVVGALGVGHWFRNISRGKLVYSGFTIIGSGILAMLLTGILSQNSIFPVLFPYLDWRVLYAHSMAVILGIGAAMVAVPLQSVLHELIPEDKRGKIMGVQFTLLSACSTFPAVIVGFGIDFLGVFWMLIIFGLPLFAFGVKGLRDRIKATRSDHASTW